MGGFQTQPLLQNLGTGTFSGSTASSARELRLEEVPLEKRRRSSFLLNAPSRPLLLLHGSGDSSRAKTEISKPLISERRHRSLRPA